MKTSCSLFATPSEVVTISIAKSLFIIAVWGSIFFTPQTLLSAQAARFNWENPLYSDSQIRQTYRSRMPLQIESIPETCSSPEQLKTILNDAILQHKALLSVRLVYNFQFEDISDTLSGIFDEIFKEDNYLNASLIQYHSSWSGLDGDVTLEFDFTYLTTLTQEEWVTERVLEILYGEAPLVNENQTPEEKVKVIHDWVVLNVEYDIELEYYSAYDALFLGKTVCQGYALLTHALMHQAGVPVKIITGGNHAWNMVYLCGSWYHVDATWDDPLPDLPGRVIYEYFNLSDLEMQADHTWEALDYPKAQATYVEGICSIFPDLPDSYLVCDISPQLLEAESGSHTCIYGMPGEMTVQIPSKAKVQLLNFPGETTINIDGTSSDFYVYRSGATVFLESSGTIELRLAAKPIKKHLQFTDNSFDLSIENNGVILGQQPVTTTPRKLVLPVIQKTTSGIFLNSQ